VKSKNKYTTDTANRQAPASQSPAETTPIHYTEYPSLTAARQPAYRETTWGDLRRSLTSSRPTLDKISAPLWAPYKLSKPHRLGENVEEISALVLDLDQREGKPLSDQDLTEVLGRLDGLEYLAHTTHSDHSPGRKWRVVLPLKRAVLASVWPKFWRSAIAKFAREYADPACKDLARCYFLPSHLPGSEPDHIHNPGALLDPGEILLYEPPASADADAPIAVRREFLDRIARRWQRSKKLQRAADGEALASVVAGESFAEHGHRDTTATRLIWALVHELPAIDPDELAKHFGQSLGAMPGTKLTVESIADKARRAKEKLSEDVDFAERKRLALAFGSDRAARYTETELENLREQLAADELTFQHAWIIRSGKDGLHILRGDGGYFFSQGAHLDTIKQELAPAPIPLTKVTDLGEKPRSLSELVLSHGFIAQRVDRCLALQQARIDLPKKTLRLPACPMRDIRPEFSAEVAGWLEILGDRVQDWLAVVTKLDHPCTALTLIGTGDTGKSLLAAGVTQLWADAPTSLEAALSNFSGEISSCPIVLGEERIPHDFQGRAQTEELRRLISETSRRANEKYRSLYTLTGACRVIITANNESLFALPGSTTNDDLGAIAERFTRVRLGAEPRDYLREIGGREHIQRVWLDEGALSMHIMWLNENREVKRQGRFWLPPDESLTAQLSVQSGLRAGVCEWCVGYLLAPRKAVLLGDDVNLVKVAHGTLFVNVTLLRDHWDVYCKTRTPTISALAAALAGVSKMNENGMFAIDTEKLKMWAGTTGVCSPSALGVTLMQKESKCA